MRCRPVGDAVAFDGTSFRKNSIFGISEDRCPSDVELRGIALHHQVGDGAGCRGGVDTRWRIVRVRGARGDTALGAGLTPHHGPI